MRNDCRGQQQEEMLQSGGACLLFEGQTAGYAQVNNDAQESLQRLSGDYNVTDHVGWSVAWLSGLYELLRGNSRGMVDAAPVFEGSKHTAAAVVLAIELYCLRHNMYALVAQLLQQPNLVPDSESEAGKLLQGFMPGYDKFDGNAAR